MKQNLKPIHEQVVVITGASSGIGRETALQFAERGATVVPIARNREALDSLRQEVERLGSEAHPTVADVSDWEQVKGAADEVAERFGRIDTWVNNAAISLYATVEQASMEEIRRMIDVILLGQIHGMKAALPHLKREGRGAIINVASALARRSVPLQAAYCAAKHGIKGFTESLRMELEHENSGVSVTLILPSSINTPLFEHARSKMGVMPQPLPPVYEPQVVAEAILFAAEHPRREITAGGAGKALEVLERINPKLADLYMLRGGSAFKQQKTDRPDDGRDNFDEPLPGTGRVHGQFGQKSKSVSTYTRNFEEHPERKRLLTLGALAGFGLLLGTMGATLSGGSKRDHRERTPRAQRQEHPSRQVGEQPTDPSRGAVKMPNRTLPDAQSSTHPETKQQSRGRSRGVQPRSIATDAILGAAAGLAATWVMGQVTSALYKQEGEQAQKQEENARGGKAAYGVAAEKSAQALGTDLSEEQRKRYGNAIHWALGAGAGTLYAVLRPRTTWASRGLGSLYGALFFLVVDEGANTALELAPPPQEFPWETHARGLAGHVVFGVATEAVLQLADDL